MRVNSIQNRNNNRTKFGCNYCRVTEALLKNFDTNEVSNILSRVNPENPIEAQTCKALAKVLINPFELHIMRADMILSLFEEMEKQGRIDKIIPSKLEDLVTSFKKIFDKDLGLRIGEDF